MMLSESCAAQASACRHEAGPTEKDNARKTITALTISPSLEQLFLISSLRLKNDAPLENDRILDQQWLTLLTVAGPHDFPI